MSSTTPIPVSGPNKSFAIGKGSPPAPAGVMKTETGDIIVTETGDNVVVE